MVIEPMTAALAQTPSGGLGAAALDGVMTLLEGKSALAIGPGIGTDPDTRELVKGVVATASVPMVIDADGLNCIADDPGILGTANAPVILTPHPGEMARLTGKTTADIQHSRMETARNFAEQYKVIMVLKGAQTLVACPDGAVFICPTGNPGMACGGMGDVLTGMIAAFLAQDLSPESAAFAGVYLHGLCGDLLAEEQVFGFCASDMTACIPHALTRPVVMKTVTTQSPAQTQDTAGRLGRYIREQHLSCAMALTGDLGCGKTCFVQGLAKGLGVADGYYITSPTFTIMNEYPAGKMHLCHLDLYRLSDPDELDYIGIEDRIDQDSVTIVEWPDLLIETGFVFDLHIHFEFDANFNRQITFSPSGQAGINLLSNLSL